MSSRDGETGDFAIGDELFSDDLVFGAVPACVVHCEVWCWGDGVFWWGGFVVWAIGADVVGDVLEVELLEFAHEQVGAAACRSGDVFREFVLSDGFELC